jgi:hypothetical protein
VFYIRVEGGYKPDEKNISVKGCSWNTNLTRKYGDGPGAGPWKEESNYK